MRRLITWSIIILLFGLGLMWMVTSAQANPRSMPPEKTDEPAPTTTGPAAPGPSISEQVGAAARSAVDKAKEVSAQVVEKSGEIATQVGDATKDAAAKTSEVASEAAKQVGEATKQATDKAKEAASDFTKGFNQPTEPAKP